MDVNFCHLSCIFFLSLVFFFISFADSTDINEIERNISNLEKAKLFSPEWMSTVREFLKENTNSQNLKKEQGEMRYIPPILETYTKNVVTDSETYDYIVVGCGASGCPAAGILAKNGKKVLVLERGQERSHEQTPEAMDIYGTGIGINDPEISQPIVTKQGIRTHVASVMGGGTSINLAIMIQETKDFFEYLGTFPGVKLDIDLLQQAIAYANEFAGNNMPPSPLFTNYFSNALASQGFERLGNQTPPLYADTLSVGNQWSCRSLFNCKNSFYRNASDVFLIDPKTNARYTNLTVKSQSSVEFVEFDRTGPVPEAQCVIYHPTTLKDIFAQGSEEPGVLSSEAISLFLSTFLDPIAGIDNIKNEIVSLALLRKRVCINEGGRIVLSAGAIFTPVLLYKSGIGRREQIEKLGLDLVLENNYIGQNFIDRVFIPVSGFLKEKPTIPVDQNGLPPFSLREMSDIPNVELLSRENMYNAAVAAADKAIKSGLTRETAEEVAKQAASEVADNDEISQRVLGLIPTLLRPFFDFNPQNEGTYPDFPFAIESLKFIPQPKMFSARISDIVAIKNVGPDCSGKSINSESLTCSLINVEDLYGGHTAEGVIFATRFIFPPYLRGDPGVSFIFNILVSCSRGRKPYNSMLLDKLCLIVQPVIGCFRRTASTFTFNTEPKSRGKIELTEKGELFVNANYLQNEQDLFDAVRGTQNLIQMMNSDAYKDILESKDDPKACPFSVLNGLLNLILSLVSMKSVLPDLPSFIGVEEHIQSLLPQRPQRSAEVSEKELQEKEKENSQVFKRLSEQNPALREAIEKCFTSCPSNPENNGICPARDICCTAYGNALCSPLKDQHEELLVEAANTSGYNREVQEKIGTRGIWFFNAINNMYSTEKQWAATFPPKLADPDDPAKVAEYALTYMSSIWHFANTVPLGNSVDPNFNLIGVNGLSILDASVLPQMTRMNPTATLLGLGIYGAAKILANSGESGKFF